MRIYGIDFTSAPRAAKPITCAVCDLTGDQLAIESLQTWHCFAGFEAFLQQPGPWTAAVDFPLGQPRRLVAALGWPADWDSYVSVAGEMTKADFVELIDQYRQRQPPGDKHHLRATDKLAGSCSPMMLYGVPVGKMFYEGAPRLQRAGVSVSPCRPNGSTRSVIEGYPALVARHFIGGHAYKSETTDSPKLQQARRQLLAHCQSSLLHDTYGMTLELSREVEQQLITDSKGDAVDAALGAVQAAAFELREHHEPLIPPQADPLEGWIVDPTYGN